MSLETTVDYDALVTGLRYCALCNSTGIDPVGGNCRSCGGELALERRSADAIEQLQKEVERLREFEWMYKELCK